MGLRIHNTALSAPAGDAHSEAEFTRFAGTARTQAATGKFL